MPKPICEVNFLGKIKYQKAWDLQNQFAREIAAGERPPTLLLLEHPHTFTFGRSGEASNLLWDEAELAQRGVAVHWVDRGGDVTYHGPGQLVGYPLFPLGTPVIPKDGTHIPRADYVSYIRKLERVIIMAVAEFGVEARTFEGLTGVWIENHKSSIPPGQGAGGGHSSITKLAAIGVKVDVRGISRHGFALNVHPEMSYWDGIVGCGLAYPEVSLAQLLEPIPEMQAVIEAVISAFGKIFNYQMLVMAIRKSKR